MTKLEQTIKILDDLNVKELVAYDFEKTSPFYDYFVIATVNDRQSMAAFSHFKKEMTEDVKNVEGKDSGWALIDLGDIIVHLFKEEERKFYNFDTRLLGVKKVY
ncbi:Iojap-like protein [Alteracholeplasma palmae J233]|uniref:Iojap-like protein n=1 Tax=Alteracholeplasma palmae (strain ATCC 49389 / J233) TaxID=1318466 RepID=U4KPR8_ALTPJ|nr:ribosome silencing factor [Alteracholeplasma palmae]CCV64280.1 Iojap-like protein [Alteracholeplasma palmae J233]